MKKYYEATEDIKTGDTILIDTDTSEIQIVNFNTDKNLCVRFSYGVEGKQSIEEEFFYLRNYDAGKNEATNLKKVVGAYGSIVHKIIEHNG